MRAHHLALSLLSISLFAVACGGEAQENPDKPIVLDEPDMMAAVDMKPQPTDMGDDEEDIPTIGDDIGNNTPDDTRRATVIKEWPLLMKQAPAGSVNSMMSAGVYEATIDASAGGSMASRENPFVYLDLETGAQVQIDDIASLDDTVWELGFKRTAIRTNSGDSGKGQTRLAKRSGTTFEAVTQAPTDPNEYTTDETLNAEGELRADPIGTPYTAFNYLNLNNPTGSASWYSYQMGVSPVEGDIYIVKSATSQTHFKVEILSWTSGVFKIRWRAL